MYVVMGWLCKLAKHRQWGVTRETRGLGVGGAKGKAEKGGKFSFPHAAKLTTRKGLEQVWPVLWAVVGPYDKQADV